MGQEYSDPKREDMPYSLPDAFEAWEVSHCGELADAPGSVEVLTSAEAAALPSVFSRSFWTLYGWREGAGVEAVGDFDTQEHALHVLGLIVGREIAPFQGTTESYKRDGEVWK